MFSLTLDRIDPAALSKALLANEAGALVTFEGWVRDHNLGKPVTSLEYQVYPRLAEKEGARILEEAREKFGLHRASCVHRYGHLGLGEAAVWIGATSSHRDEAYRASRYIIDEIKRRLPIWKKEHYRDEPAVWVQCQGHHTHVHFDDSEYYAKQAKLVDQSRLRAARVLVVGAGGLGCPALLALANAGVGRLTIVDSDQVELSNLHRQPLYTPDNVGERKAAAARVRISVLNPLIEVEAIDTRVTAENVEALFSGHSLILDCTDNLETKFLLHDACFKAGVPLVSASLYRFEGQLRTFDPNARLGCLRCAQPETPDDSLLGNCNDFGVLGATASAIGALQASEAIAYLLTGTNATLGETLFFDVKTLRARKFRGLRREGCATCLGEVSLQASSEFEIGARELSKDVRLVDIRDEDDGFLDQFRGQPQSKIVVYCHRGIRSRKLVLAQRAQGYRHFYSLKGGACSL